MKLITMTNMSLDGVMQGLGDPDEDRRRHTVSDGGVVVVAAGEEPFIGPIEDEALHLEAEADRRG